MKPTRVWCVVIRDVSELHTVRDTEQKAIDVFTEDGTWKTWADCQYIYGASVVRCTLTEEE